MAGQVNVKWLQARGLRAFWAGGTLRRKAEAEVGVSWEALEFSMLKEPLEDSKR